MEILTVDGDYSGQQFVAQFLYQFRPSFSCRGKNTVIRLCSLLSPTAHVSCPSSHQQSVSGVPFSRLDRSNTNSSQLSKRTVLRDLQGLLTVDVAHLGVGMRVRRDEVSFGLVVEGGLRWCCKARKKKVDFGTRNNSSCVCRPRAALLRADGWRPTVIGRSGLEWSQAGGVAGGVGIE